MATGGSGDVLTGIILGLLAQGYTSLEACLVGTYLHGLAGDLASEDLGYEASLASDITVQIGYAYQASERAGITSPAPVLPVASPATWSPRYRS